MVSQRFFIGNLPSGTSENDVKKPFKDFGDITNIELKEKASLVDPSDVKILAFVTLNLYDDNVDFCLKKLNSKQINGEYIRVSVAKESFLERLKREREENSKGKPKTSTSNSSNNPFQLNQPSFNNEPVVTSNSKKYFNTDDVEGDEDGNDDEEPILITKKRAANSMRNGKIVIESTNCSPIAVIGKKKESKELSEKSLDSDKKRKESVNKKKNQYQLQKSLIQKSLASVDSSKKQIFFEHHEEDEETEATASANGKQLFNDDSDNEDNTISKNFAVKPEYEGARGAALMKLQSKMTSDPRFKVDSKFVDDVQEDEPKANENSERDWQYGILEQVVGSKVSSAAQPKGRSKNKLNMMRYDPSKENQDQYLIQPKAAEPMDQDHDEDMVRKPEEKKVSKEVFYMVSENLSNSLKTRGDGFSLLSMFGRGTDEPEQTEKASSKEKILISKGDKSGALNPFSYDSSSESENENESKSQAKNDASEQTKGKAKDDGKAKLFIESFFIRRNDIRLKEGKLFFRSNKMSEKIENYDEVKDKLKNIINRKITRSKKQLKGIGKQRSIRGR